MSVNKDGCLFIYYHTHRTHIENSKN